MFVKMLDTQEVETLSKAFTTLDKEATGMITKLDFKDTIKKTKTTLSDEEIEEIFEQVDSDGNQKINYSEFIAATINVKQYLTEEKLRAIFM